MSVELIKVVSDQYKELKQDNKEDHQKIMEVVKRINGDTLKNTNHRIEWSAKLSVFKWLIGLLGAGNIANLTYMWATNFQR